MSAPQSLKQGLPPVVGVDTKLLILGSLPGDQSLRASAYYAHPRNQFWDLIGEVIGVPLRPLPYEERLQVLCARRIGLWDVVARASRRGSLDSAIRDLAINPLLDFIGSLPELTTVAFNGRLAYAQGSAALPNLKDVSLVSLPSSSPAHCIDFIIKRDAWLVLRDALDLPDDQRKIGGDPA